MLVLVCGSRKWPATRKGPIHAWLEGLWAESSGRLTVVEGGATGADRIAGDWAKRTAGVDWQRVDARWDDYPPNEKWRAGHDRNQQMLDWILARPQETALVLAFKDDFDWTLKKGGTEDMVRRAQEAGVTAYVTAKVSPVGRDGAGSMG